LAFNDDLSPTAEIFYTRPRLSILSDLTQNKLSSKLFEDIVNINKYLKTNDKCEGDNLRFSFNITA
jgi:hypothetical protein